MEKVIAILEREAKQASENYKFHLAEGDKYNLKTYFDGQRAIIRKLKTEIKKIK